ncbi:Uncharacterized protein Rs2_48577 [Raphanus sativus]|nr:Uncharacterized protein Rs2_49642 [Raphanus sativus]KAJ4869852.1 Uncharacterized protein Rs2_48577 [Raphanus sativus]
MSSTSNDCGRRSATSNETISSLVLADPVVMVPSGGRHLTAAGTKRGTDPRQECSRLVISKGTRSNLELIVGEMKNKQPLYPLPNASGSNLRASSSFEVSDVFSCHQSLHLRFYYHKTFLAKQSECPHIIILEKIG